MTQPLETQILARARAIISDPKRWTVDFAAVDKYDNSCSPFGADAVKFCGIGALMRAAGDLISDRREAKNQAIRVARIVEDHTGADIEDVNDNLGRCAVLAMFDRALSP